MVNTRQPTTHMCDETKPGQASQGEASEGGKRRERDRRLCTNWQDFGDRVGLLYGDVWFSSHHPGCALKGTKFHNEIKLGTRVNFSRA